LEETNPEAYQGVAEQQCINDGGIVCNTDEECTGYEQITAVSGNYKNVRCCYQGECEKDNSYGKLNTAATSGKFSSDTYSEMYKYSMDYCEDEQIGTNDPFKSGHVPSSWGAFIKSINDMGEGSSKVDAQDEAHYFKGLIYLLCRNCEEADDEFDAISENSEYYKPACGENLKEEGQGGYLFEYCSETCKIIQKTTLRLDLLTLKDTYMAKVVSVSSDKNTIDLDSNRAYTVEQLDFNIDMAECSFKVNFEDNTNFQPLTVDEKDKTKCTSVKYFTIPSDSGSYTFTVKGKSSEDSTYEKSFILSAEKIVGDGQVLKCKTTNNDYFCISVSGEKCSDYHHNRDTDKKGEYVVSFSSPTDCIMDNRYDCSRNTCDPSYWGYGK